MSKTNGWKWNGYMVALWGVMLCSAVAQRVWIAGNQAPPGLLDDADHLWTSLALYQTWSRAGWAAWVRQCLHTASHYYHPPLIPALTAPVYAWLGPSVAAALWINNGFMVLLYGYLFKLVRRMAGDAPALVAVIFVALFPMMYGLQRLYLLEYGMSAFVVVWLYYFHRSQGLTEKRGVLWLGLLLGGGLLIKATFPMYIAGPIAWDLLYRARTQDKAARRTTVRRLLWIAGIGIFLAWSWYWNNAAWVWVGARYTSGDLSRMSVLKTALQWAPLRDFVIEFLEECVSVYFVVLGLVCLGWLILHRESPRDQCSGPAPFGYRVGFLCAGWLVPFLVCSLMLVKVSRYMLPALPAFAALLSLVVVCALPASPARRAWVLGGLLLIPLGNFLQLSFFDVWTRGPGRVLAALPLKLVDTVDGHELTHRPRRESWPFPEMLEALRTHTTVMPPKEIRGSIYFTSYPLVPTNLMFAGMAQNISLVFFPLYCDEKDELVACLEKQADREFIIVERPAMNWLELEKVLDSGLTPYREVATFKLPKPYPSQVAIYQRHP